MIICKPQFARAAEHDRAPDTASCDFGQSNGLRLCLRSAYMWTEAIFRQIELWRRVNSHSSRRLAIYSPTSDFKGDLVVAIIGVLGIPPASDPNW